MRVARATLLLALTSAACVAPARWYGAYEGKAASTAETALSAVATARAAALAGARGDAFGPYVSTAIADAESDVGSAQGLFDSIQPPDAASERLRAELDPILTRATGEITALRIRARWTDVSTFAAAAARLRALAGRLEGFLERHG